MSDTKRSATEATAAGAAALAVHFAFSGQAIEAVILGGVSLALFLLYEKMGVKDVEWDDEQLEEVTENVADTIRDQLDDDENDDISSDE